MQESDRHLGHLAARIQGDRFFLESALHSYAISQGLDDYGLAHQLGCSTEDLIRLRLCRRPDGVSSQFLSDVAAIAQRFGLDVDTLAALLRHADSLYAFQRSPSEGHGMLAAARDQEAEYAPDESDKSP